MLHGCVSEFVRFLDCRLLLSLALVSKLYRCFRVIMPIAPVPCMMNVLTMYCAYIHNNIIINYADACTMHGCNILTNQIATLVTCSPLVGV